MDMDMDTQGHTLGLVPRLGWVEWAEDSGRQWSPSI
jgi:hypothetical protein